MWEELVASGDIAADRHWHLKNDEWLEACLDYPTSILAEEYHLKVRHRAEPR
jgi:hypothetical protein